jgi:hypothetical protein
MGKEESMTETTAFLKYHEDRGKFSGPIILVDMKSKKVFSENGVPLKDHIIEGEIKKDTTWMSIIVNGLVYKSPLVSDDVG